MQNIRDRLWPRHVRRPWARLLLGLVLAPLSATLVIAAVAFLIAGLSEATQTGTLAVTIDATFAFVSFAAVLMVTAVLPGLIMLTLLGWRSSVVWAALGALAGIATAYLIAEMRGSPLFPAVPVGAMTAAYLMLVLRSVAGIRREPPEIDPEDPRYVP